MRRFTLSFLALFMSCLATNAQVVATFDTFSLLTTYPDTSYVDYSMPGVEIGFTDGGAYFPSVFDTSFGGTWLGGITYSNRSDSATLDYMNDQSAITAVGYDSSTGYAIVFQGFGFSPYITVTDTAAAGDSVLGFYITNTTYAYKTIRDGYFSATKFGDSTGDKPDWFLLTIHGYNNGQLIADSVDFYLADYRFTNNADDYIVGDWQWVDLTSLGLVDSLTFTMTSSDTAGGFGMNTPAYFAMDNFTTKAAPVSVKNIAESNVAKLYPNPANDVLYVEVNNKDIQQVSILDLSGKLLSTQTVTESKVALNVSTLPSGTYFVQLTGNGQNAGTRFVKQ